MKAYGLILIALITFCFITSTYSDDTYEKDVLVASYDTVWQTVNENHYDTTFCGLDWNEIYNRYHKKISEILGGHPCNPVRNTLKECADFGFRGE